MKKVIMLAVTLVFCLGFVFPAAAALDTVSVVSVQAVAEVFENGMTVTAVRLEYPEEINSITVAPRPLFEIAGREINRVYVNNTGEPGDVEYSGKYVFLQLRAEDTPWNDNRETWGTMWMEEGQRNTAVYLPIVVAGKQHTFFQTASGKYAEPVSFTNDSERILVVEDFVNMEATDPETGLTMYYKLYIPEGYEVNSETLEDLPLVVFLHGSGERGTDNMSQMVCYRQGLEFAFPEAQAENPAFIMMPQSRDEGWWIADEAGNYLPAPSLKAVMAAVDELKGKYNIDENKLYAAGCSMGGRGSNTLLFTYPETFAAGIVLAFGGQYTEEQYKASADIPVWYLVGEGDNAESTTTEIVENIKKSGTKVYEVLGENTWDAYLRDEAAEALALDALKGAEEMGANKIFVKYMGGSIQPDPHHIHMATWNNDVIRKWLFAQTKGEEASYVPANYSVERTAATTHGDVKGLETDGITVFRSIPYGADLDGANRFLAPKPVENWEGVLDCTTNRTIAMQSGNYVFKDPKFADYFSGGKLDAYGMENETQSENCLNVNVVTPGLDDKARPVVVYIHGGGYSNGAGTLVIGAGDYAKEEDFVLVGVHARVNIFGFLYLGEIDAKYEDSGAAGLLDLVLALEWIRDNIAEFGGDPNDVTLIGESGGGSKINSLLNMPAAKGLFHKVVIQSGSTASGTYTKEQGTAVAKGVLAQLGVAEDNLEALAGLTTEKIMTALTGNNPLTGINSTFNPVADGKNLMLNPEGLFVTENTITEIPVLVGTSQDESASSLPIEKMFGVTWENIRETLLSDNLGFITEANVDKVIEVVRGMPDNKGEAPHTYLMIHSVLRGQRAYQEVMQFSESQETPVYSYWNAVDSPIGGDLNYRASWHTAELPLYFRLVQREEGRKLSDAISEAVSAFVKTGNPSTETLEWKPFDAETKNVMVFGDTFEQRSNPMEPLLEAIFGE